MNERQYIDIYVNTAECERVISADDFHPPQDSLEMFRGSQYLLRFHLLDGDGNQYAVPESATFLFGIDTVFDPDHDDVVTSNNDEFDVTGDWTEINRSEGKISCRVNMNTTDLKTALGSSERMNGYVGLWMTPSGGTPTLLWHEKIILKNIAVDPLSPSANPGPTYVTTDMLSAIIEQATEGGVGVVRIKFPDGSTAEFWKQEA